MKKLLKTFLVFSAFACFAGYPSSLFSQAIVGEYRYKVPVAIMPRMALSEKGNAGVERIAYRRGRSRTVDLKLAYAMEYVSRERERRVLPLKFKSPKR